MQCKYAGGSRIFDRQEVQHGIYKAITTNRQLHID